MEQERWHWQESGTAWRGVGVYHITLTVPSHEPLLGRLVIPDGDPTQARVERTELGRLLLDCQRSVPVYHPEIQILQYCLMPDHLHTVWYVRRPMKKSIRQVVQGFWQAAKKVGRAYSYMAALTGGTKNETSRPGEPAGALTLGEPAGALRPGEPAGGLRLGEPAGGLRPGEQAGGLRPGEPAGGLRPGFGLGLSSIATAGSRENPLCQMLGVEAYRLLPPVFTEMPFVRPLSRRGQLRAMIRYVQMNPQRLATKRLMPGFFRVQKGIEIAGRSYDGVGNVALLHEECYDVVHVRSVWVKAAERGERKDLRDYMNSRVLKARKGVVMVSPFISPQEKQVMQVLLDEQRPFILLADNGFREYYKPSDNLFDACAEGRLLILSPWQYDAGKRHISRADCMALNAMAEEIAGLSTR